MHIATVDKEVTETFTYLELVILTNALTKKIEADTKRFGEPFELTILLQEKIEVLLDSCR